MPTELERRRIYAEVMECFYRGELRAGGTNELVTSVVQAQAIASKRSYRGTLDPPQGNEDLPAWQGSR